MKVRADRKALAETLQWVAQAIAKIPAQPVLAGVRITATEQGLTLAAFDWHTSHTARLSAEVADDGEVVVSGHYLRSILSAMRDANVDLVVEGSELVISGKRAAYRTRLMPVEDYPALPDHPAAAGTTDAAMFIAAIAAVRPAVEDQPPSSDLAAIAGIRLETSEDGLEFAATDRFIVISVVVDWFGDDFEATPPGKALEAAVKGMTGTLRIGRTEGVLGISDDTRAVTTRLIDDEHPFPPAWRRLLRPHSEDTFEVKVDRDELHAALMATTSLTAGSVALGIGETEIEIATTIDEKSLGSGTDYVAAESTGADTVLHMPRRLADGLAAMPAGDVRIGVVDPLKPFILRPVDFGGRIAVVMPMRPAR